MSTLFRFSRIKIAFLALSIVFVSGILGYRQIENFTLLESLYMTIITISTVGFSEIRPLSEEGRLFTIFLIITSFGIFAFALSAITSYIFTGELRNYFKEKKLKKTIGQLENHVIICGYGRNGKKAAEEFYAHNKTFVVIENNSEVILSHGDKQGYLVIQGDSTRDEILEMAHIERAEALISTLPDDADNLLTVLTARELNKDLLIISRASHDKTHKKLIFAGANNVIMPDKIGGAQMASLVLRPDVVEFFDKIITHDPRNPLLKEVNCNELSGDEKDHTVEELKLIKKSGVMIIGMKMSDGQYIINPSNDTVLSPSSKLFVLGTEDQIAMLDS